MATRVVAAAAVAAMVSTALNKMPEREREKFHAPTVKCFWQAIRLYTLLTTHCSLRLRSQRHSLLRCAHMKLKCLINGYAGEYLQCVVRQPSSNSTQHTSRGSWVVLRLQSASVWRKLSSGSVFCHVQIISASHTRTHNIPYLSIGIWNIYG